MLTVSSFEGELVVESITQLKNVLARKDAALDANSFMLAPKNSEYPQLGIFVRGQVAVLHYMTADQNFISNNAQSKDTAEMIIFYENSAGMEVQIPFDAVVPQDSAVAAATQFFLSNNLPEAVSWLEI